jgi:hypothetical protein
VLVGKLWTNLCASTATAPETIVLAQRLSTRVAVEGKVDVWDAQLFARGNGATGDDSEAIGAAFIRWGQGAGRRREVVGFRQVAHLD